MTEHETPGVDVEEKNDDSTTDAICAVALILIAVVTMIYWVSGQ
ncbi:MAG: hypothetical protein ACFHX7_00665 [Pseudomonadota bacterium]